jgi:PAS domain S-box-containing protein
VAEGTLPVVWSGRQAVVSLPDRVDIANADLVAAELQSVIGRGPAVLIADLTKTLACDQVGVDAVSCVYYQALIGGTQLRLAVSASSVRRALSRSGIDRLVAVYPTLDAAAAAVADNLAPAVLVQLIDALSDGVALTDDEGTIALANRRLEDMLGYGRDELAGRSIDELVPEAVRAAHARYRAAYVKAPVARPMAGRQRLVGLRRDGGTLPLQITLNPVPTATGHFTLAIVRDATQAARSEDLADLAGSAYRQEARTQQLLDQVTRSLHHVGLSLHAAVDQPREEARERIGDALRRLDDTIQQIRAHALSTHARGGGPPASSPDGLNGTNGANGSNGASG